MPSHSVSPRYLRIVLTARILLAVTIFILLQRSWDALRNTAVGYVMIHMLTVAPAVFLINLLTPSAHAIASGSRFCLPAVASIS